MSYFIGIDGGATKTTCAVGDDSTVLATATTGSSNIVRVGEVKARESIQDAIRQACAAAGILPEQVTAACVGASGAGRPKTASLIRGAVADILPAPTEIVGDMEIALDAAFQTGPGVIVIAGTGSIAYGRDLDGRTARSGGWGYAVSDEGSAFWIGRAAVAAAVRDLGSARPGASHALTPFVAALLRTWHSDSLDDVVRIANSSPPPDFAALLPAVLDSEADSTRAILVQAGRELARLASVVCRLLFGPSSEPVPIAMAGGVFRYASRVRESFYNEVRVLEPRAELEMAIVNPVEGALLIARRLGRESGAR